MGVDLQDPDLDRKLEVVRSRGAVKALLRAITAIGAASSLIFGERALAEDLEDNLAVARRTLFVTHAASMALALGFLLFHPVAGLVGASVCVVSFLYLGRTYRRCAQVLREDEVRKIMES